LEKADLEGAVGVAVTLGIINGYNHGVVSGALVLAVALGVGLLGRSLLRARRLKHLPPPPSNTDGGA